MATSDNLFHAALAQMIAHYEKVTTGADGLVYQRYYFVSHAVAAGLSRLGSVDVPLVYVYWGAVSLKLQFIWAAFLAVVLLDAETDLPKLNAMSYLAFAWFVAVLTHALESESFVLAVALFLLLLPIFCSVPRRGDRRTVILVVVALSGAFICAATKASVCFFIAIALLGLLGA